MEVIVVNKESFEAFEPLIPKSVLTGKVMILGCVEEEKILGSAVIAMEEAMLLTWIYVEEKEREKGAGALLLDTAIAYRDAQAKRKRFGVIFPPDMEDGDRLYAMLVRRDFAVTVSERNNYILPMEEVKEALMAEPGSEHSSAIQITPIGRVDAEKLLDYTKAVANASGVNPDEEDLLDEDVDTAHSYALFSKGELLGLFLGQRSGKSKRLTVTSLSVHPKSRPLAMPFVKRVLRSIREEGVIRELEFLAMNASVEKGVRQYFPEGLHCETERVAEAVLM